MTPISSSTTGPTLTCTSCKYTIPLPPLVQNQGMMCESCGMEYRVWTFPALHRPMAQPKPAAQIMIDGEAACFFHPTKSASIPCDQCGRFLCSLCDLDFGGKHYCPSCIDQKKSKARSTDLENVRPTHDSAALLMALLPIAVWPFTFLTAPVAIFYGIRALRSPGSLITRKPWRAYLAIALATLQLCGWTILVVKMFA